MIYDLQKASVLKRFSAFLLDAICVCIVATLFAWLLSAIVDFGGWSAKYDELKTAHEQKYGINTLTKDEYDALSDSEKKEYDEKNEQAKQEAERALREAYMAKDPVAVETVRTIDMVNNLILLMISVGCFFGFFIVEFIVPLFFKNGQTLGKKIFSVAVMRTATVRINSVCLFIRSMLGKFAIETMIPLYILIRVVFLGSGNVIDVALLAALTLSQILIFFVTKTRSFIHDLLADTVTVDMATQMIFDTEDDLIRYKEKLHEAEVKASDY